MFQYSFSAAPVHASLQFRVYEWKWCSGSSLCCKRWELQNSLQTVVERCSWKGWSRCRLDSGSGQMAYYASCRSIATGKLMQLDAVGCSDWLNAPDCCIALHCSRQRHATDHCEAELSVPLRLQSVADAQIYHATEVQKTEGSLCHHQRMSLKPNVFKIHVLMLDVCWKFAGRLLDHVNTLLVIWRKLISHDN